MNKHANPWQSLIIPTTVLMAVTLSNAPGIPAMSPPPVNVWDSYENNHGDFEEDWGGKNASLRTLTQIQNLEHDWDGDAGEAIPEEVIILSKSIVMSLKYQPEIYPTKRRTVQMQYETADRSYLEFEVYADRIEMLSVPQRKYENAVESTIRAANYYEMDSIVKDFMLA